MPKKILIALGTRPEVIKLAPLILALRESDLKDEFFVVSTSQHDELLEQQLGFWNIKPDFCLHSSPQKKDLVRLLANTLIGLQDIIDKEPSIEYIVVQGDTNTALSCANLSKLNKLKLVHIEAGLRSFDLEDPFPEEFNRVIASKVAYFHFAPTLTSKRNLINEGVNENKILVVGNTGIDALKYFSSGSSLNIKNENADVLITLHRRENTTNNYLVLIEILTGLARANPHLKFLWVVHPNNRENVLSNFPESENVKVIDPIAYHDFISLYKTVKTVITDSGGVTEEAVELGIPVVVFREKTERVEPLEMDYPMVVTIDKKKIENFFEENIERKNEACYSYGNGKTSIAIVNWFRKELFPEVYDTVIIGGGPAGTGLLLKSFKDGGTNKLLTQRIAIIERSSSLIKGTITSFAVNSDTFSDVFLECLEGETGKFINNERLAREIEFLRGFKGRSIPLCELNEYYEKLGALLKDSLTERNLCDFYMNSVARRVEKERSHFKIFINSDERFIIAKKTVIATGGSSKEFNLEKLNFGEDVSLKNYSSRFLSSDKLLRSGIEEDLSSSLKKIPKVVILGGSHSAFSAAHFLLSNKEYAFGPENIKIWSRSLPKLYFPTKVDANESGYNDFNDKDICPVTHKVYRLAGLRMDGRDLYMRMLALSGLEKENRVTLKILGKNKSEMEHDLSEATVIVVAFGYKLNIIPFYNEINEAILFKGEKTGHWVNDNCELLDEDGSVISNVYATGLATGFIPSGELGGEPSFQGQTNGIWYYQNAIADRIISRL